MSEHQYTYHDENFSLDGTEAYTLLIQIEKETFSYAIIDGNTLIAWSENHPADELRNPQELLDILSAKYKDVVIGLTASAFTLVPNSLFSDDRVTGFARFLDVKPGEKILAQPLDKENVVVYKTADAMLSAAEEFGLRNTVFASQGLIAAIAQSNPGGNDLYLNVENDKAEFIYFKSRKLRFYNSFEFKNDDELMYFAALVSNELNLPMKHTSLYLSGDINDDGPTMALLNSFFLRAQINSHKVVVLPEEVIAHRLFSLAALSLCVSSEVV